MSRESVLARGRVRAESRMTDTCKVGLKVRSDEIDPATGLYVEAIEAVYEGPCEIQFGTTQPNQSDSGSQIITTQDVVLKLPVSATTALVNDEHHALVTDSANDPGLVGLMFRILGFNAKTFSTARRFPVELDS